jgi:epoxyqueuosine reductase
VEKRRRDREPPAGAEPNVSLARWLSDDAGELVRRYDRLYVPRKDARHLRRNALVALGNTGGPGDAPLAEAHARSDDPLLAEHAVWALERIGSRG